MSYFGTDGIRGKFGELPITPEFALKLGFAAGKVLKRNSKNKPLVVLGKDTRLSGYILESALQAGLNAAGVYVHLLGPLPTPAIAHLTVLCMPASALSFLRHITRILITGLSFSRVKAKTA